MVPNGMTIRQLIEAARHTDKTYDDPWFSGFRAALISLAVDLDFQTGFKWCEEYADESILANRLEVIKDSSNPKWADGYWGYLIDDNCFPSPEFIHLYNQQDTDWHLEHEGFQFGASLVNFWNQQAIYQKLCEK